MLINKSLSELPPQVEEALSVSGKINCLTETELADFLKAAKGLFVLGKEIDDALLADADGRDRYLEICANYEFEAGRFPDLVAAQDDVNANADVYLPNQRYIVVDFANEICDTFIACSFMRQKLGHKHQIAINVERLKIKREKWDTAQRKTYLKEKEIKQEALYWEMLSAISRIKNPAPGKEQHSVCRECGNRDVTVTGKGMLCWHCRQGQLLVKRHLKSRQIMPLPNISKPLICESCSSVDESIRFYHGKRLCEVCHEAELSRLREKVDKWLEVIRSKEEIKLQEARASIEIKRRKISAIRHNLFGSGMNALASHRRKGRILSMAEDRNIVEIARRDEVRSVSEDDILKSCVANGVTDVGSFKNILEIVQKTGKISSWEIKGVTNHPIEPLLRAISAITGLPHSYRGITGFEAKKQRAKNSGIDYRDVKIPRIYRISEIPDLRVAYMAFVNKAEFSHVKAMLPVVEEAFKSQRVIGRKEIAAIVGQNGVALSVMKALSALFEIPYSALGFNPARITHRDLFMRRGGRFLLGKQ
ncbi:MAG: hypothetical protein WCX69_01830 [Candidatus Paceibacterota bacterium]